ncbi:MAG: hydrogenase subunit MbhD domain-containing protein [Bacilli bacterium]|nr:hydrogenase subunit MbhD domain-containing protein [Bacilli bacterium]
MMIFKIILLLILVINAIAVAFVKDNLVAVVVYMTSSSIMSIIWILLESPDLAITEAAVGAGITSVLFFITLKKIQQIDTTLTSINQDTKEEENHEK